MNINTHDLNYGAILHSWAFQKFLSSYPDIHSEIIDYITPQFENTNLKFPAFSFYLKSHQYKAMIRSVLQIPSHFKRYYLFEEFISEQMTISPVKYTKKTLSENTLPYDVIVCESDVIWSSAFFRNCLDESFFLALPSMKFIKKIAYSPSMGNGIRKVNEMKFSELIQHLDAISCRESYAVEYTRQFTNKPVTWVCDPVLLLEEKDYEDIISPRLENEPYLLIYTPVGYDKHILNEAKLFAERHQLKIVEVTNDPLEHLLHKTYTHASIPDFLSLIKNADVVFANSFHGVCFSLLFNKNFYAFERKTGKKTEDLCKHFGLLNRYITNGHIAETDSINYMVVNQILTDFRKTSIDYIEKNILN